MTHERCYVIYADDAYFEIAEKCAFSIRCFSEYPIYAYMLNSDRKIGVSGTETIRWNCDIEEDSSGRYLRSEGNFHINRSNKSVYSILVQRPLIVRHALENFANSVAYVDSDSVATKYVDRIFSFFLEDSKYPAFVEGIYNYLSFGNRGIGGASDLKGTLEYPACVLFGVDQSVRDKYRQTGYFVSGQECVEFLQEWYEMCVHPHVIESIWLYAPFNEETILNVLLWKKKIFDGIPYIYINGGLDYMIELQSIGFNGERQHVRSWFSIPTKEEDLLFFHGQKDILEIDRMIEEIRRK